ncbi:MAG: YfiR family protein [Bryobacterales bacterium]|nr:YfiR family protein [Bryobacterales bacterium]
MAFLTPRRARRALLLGILAYGLCRAQVFNEYQVKAAFLYAFAKYVEWPPQAFSSASAPISICVLGDDPFGAFLDDAIRGKTVGDRPLALYRLAELPAGRDCKILFIATSERRRMAALLASASTPGLLTVGDTAEFAAQGGVIGLRRDGERIRMLVNLLAAEKAKLRISSRVLSLATIVKSEIVK